MVCSLRSWEAASSSRSIPHSIVLACSQNWAIWYPSAGQLSPTSYLPCPLLSNLRGACHRWHQQDVSKLARAHVSYMQSFVVHSALLQWAGIAPFLLLFTPLPHSLLLFLLLLSASRCRISAPPWLNLSQVSGWSSSVTGCQFLPFLPVQQSPSGRQTKYSTWALTAIAKSRIYHEYLGVRS